MKCFGLSSQWGQILKISSKNRSNNSGWSPTDSNRAHAKIHMNISIGWGHFNANSSTGRLQKKFWIEFEHIFFQHYLRHSPNAIHHFGRKLAVAQEFA